MEPQAAGRNGGDAALALRLEREISGVIRDEMERLVKEPTERCAGRIQAYRKVLDMIDPNPTDRRDL